MRISWLLVVAILVAGGSDTCRAETEQERLLGQSEPAIQNQIERVRDAMTTRIGGPSKEVAAFQEIQTLRIIVADKGEIVKQVAIYSSGPGEEPSMTATWILGNLDFSPKIVIRVLAPYLDAENKNLRAFVRDWFQGHDNAGSGWSPLKPVNYDDYLSYVRVLSYKQEQIPPAFIEYIYERHPGKALLVFTNSNQSADLVERLQAIHKARQAYRQGREATPDEVRQQRERAQQDLISRQRTKRERNEILLAEHVIGNAIWLNVNGFPERFRDALPEANAELAKLANHKEWWVRLYVAYVMRQHRELRQDAIVEGLAKDDNALVRKATQAKK